MIEILQNLKELYIRNNIKLGEPITLIIDDSGLEIYYNETQILTKI